MPLTGVAAPKAQASGAVTASVTTIDLAAAFGAQLNAALAAENDLPARFLVDGTVNIAWCYGNNPGLTYANGEVMLANSVELFQIPVGVTVISVIAGGTGSTLRIMLGDGQ